MHSDETWSVALVVAAGRGHRAGGAVPKQYRLIAGRPILRVTLEALLACPAIGAVRAVIHPDDLPLYLLAIDGLADPRLGQWIAGGGTRQDSVRCGLEALAGAPPAHVIVHDGVRPFAAPQLAAATLAALGEVPGAIAALPLADTLKRSGPAGEIAATVDRAGLFTAQTPQAFRFATLLAAHRAAAEAGRSDFTDDAALLEWRGEAVRLVSGSADNFKITTPEDFARAERRLAGPGETRTGIGYDVHAFAPGDHVMLGGVRIAHDQGVLAHSDGDVVLHALTDALLGALGEGDIGQHFPPSDPAWRGASSDRFLAFAAERVRARGGVIVHLDVAVVAEAPRVGPHRAAMRAAIARAAEIEEDRVSIKATTSERLGFTGRREGLAALAIATIALKP